MLAIEVSKTVIANCRLLLYQIQAKRPLLARVASLLAREADAIAEDAREWPDEVPEQLLGMLGSAFEEVPMFMQDTIRAA